MVYSVTQQNNENYNKNAIKQYTGIENWHMMPKGSPNWNTSISNKEILPYI